jgi:hypothetical protein
MRRDTDERRDRLESASDPHRIVRQLRDVPPHEVYEVRVDGRRAVYKRDTGPTGSAGVEGRVTAFVGRETSVPVPEVLSVGDDHYVAAWHPDAPEPDAARVADETWARTAGRTLATLHAETESHLGAFGPFRPRDGPDPVTEDGAPHVDGTEDWGEAALAEVRRRRPVLARYGHGDVADAVVDLLRDRADAFAGAGPPVCCHGWATPEHVAAADGRVACVVDFEHAVAAPAGFDYWRTVLPTFSGDDTSSTAFREGYESVRSLPSGSDRRAPFYALLNEVYYVESLHVQDQHGPRETTERAARLRENILERVERLS